MKGKAGKGWPPADLMVCFPARAHLRLMAPKPICSPSRPNADVYRPPARASPLFRVRNRGREVLPAEEVSEPTSPKVTCAGQIKVRGHGRRSTVREVVKRRRPHWLQALGFRKDVAHLIRGLRFKVGCFGLFHGSSMDCTSEEEDEDEEEEEKQRRNAFRKWFMVLDQENQRKEEDEKNKAAAAAFAANDDGGVDGGDHHSVPPPNALLLMRCRSAPASGLVAARAEKEREDQGSAKEDRKKKTMMRTTKVEEETERVAVPTSYAPDFFKLSSDIVKETWVVGNTVDPLLRSRSWKR